MPTYAYKRLLLHASALLRLVRFQNLAMVFFAQFVVFIYLQKDSPESVWQKIATKEFYYLSFATVLIAAAGYIINDYYDIKIDLVNKPRRIVVGRFIKRRHAIILHSALNAGAVLVGLLLSWRVALVLATCAFLLWLYSNYFKRTPLLGNLIISLLTALTVWIISVYFRENDVLIYMYCLFAFGISLIREIIKDMEDVKGDELFGCKTLPIRWGIAKTKQFLYLLIAVFVCSLFYISYWLPNGRLFLFSLALLLPFLYFVLVLAKADTLKDYRYLSNFCKVIMVLGILSLGMI